MKKYFITDIHGCFDEFMQLLGIIKFDSDKDLLICGGDVCDRGPKSAEVIKYLVDLPKHHILLKGNHCDWLEQDYIEKKPHHMWLHQGGSETINSLRKYKDDLTFLNTYFKRVQNYYIDEENRLFIHAGFTSNKGVKHESRASNYYWDRTLWNGLWTSLQVPINNKFKEKLYLYKEIFKGHDPTLHFKSLEPINIENVWNCDTGCAYGGRLTIMDIDSKQYWQVNSLKQNT